MALPEAVALPEAGALPAAGAAAVELAAAAVPVAGETAALVPVPRGEVTVFRGDTLVAALAAATESLGADVRVRSARRVRQGISGLLGRGRFEVTVDAGARHDGLDDAYAGLLGAANAHEVATARPPAAQVATARPPAPQVATAGTPAPQVATAGTPAPQVATAGTPAPRATTPARAPAPPPRPAAPTRPATRPARAGTVWSRAALRTVGVPDEVLAHLPERDPADDLGWTVALGAAIAAVVPPPARPTAEHPVVIDGWAGPGAVAILRAALAGARPGTVHSEQGSVPATAAELAMAVRSCLVR